jgi:2-oxoisovalerate dehydrogenase E1 component
MEVMAIQSARESWDESVAPGLVASFMKLAREAPALSCQNLDSAWIEEALRIRAVEEKLLSLFASGKMNGTVHTCVGQELSAVAVAGQLEPEDWVTSNHRCHGHFISRTKNWRGLLDELMGLASGVCKGVGSSQHLYARGFLSQGLQGALVPVAAGIALHIKRKELRGIAASFIGEGTFGEGVLYETLNLASLLELPHLIVCENNLYSQSTPQSTALSGELTARPRAFGLRVFEADTWNAAQLGAVAREAIDFVRGQRRPAFLLVRTYRLNAHSKGDDDREPAEVDFFRSHDPLAVLLLREERWRRVYADIRAEIDEHVERAGSQTLAFKDYVRDQLPRTALGHLREVSNRKVRTVQALNEGYRATLESGALHIGEDLHDPYGGAFKVTKGLWRDFPGSVITTPISEAGLVGVAIGSALMGTESYAEIMFGDFVTNACDQLVNNLSKIHHMYAFQASARARIRTPMGGKRGYGPTHSQSLEKMLVGLDNIATIYITSLTDPRATIGEVSALPCPVVVCENKVDYGRYLWQCPSHLKIRREARPAGSLLVSPRLGRPTVTIVSYGETARELCEHIEEIFVETDLIPEVVVLQMLHPLSTRLIERSLRSTRRLITIEDGSTDFGIGSEVIARLSESGVSPEKVMRIGAEPVPVPSTAELEKQVLPTMQRILPKLKAFGSEERA